MTDDFHFRNAHLAKPHSYKIGDSVLFSTKNVQLNLPCWKLSPTFVGPFSIRSLLGTNVVCLAYSDHFHLLNPVIYIAYLRPYHLRTPDIGPPPIFGVPWHILQDPVAYTEPVVGTCESSIFYWCSRTLLCTQDFIFFTSTDHFSYHYNIEDVQCCSCRSHRGRSICSYYYIFFRTGPSST